MEEIVESASSAGSAAAVFFRSSNPRRKSKLGSLEITLSPVTKVRSDRRELPSRTRQVNLDPDRRVRLSGRGFLSANPAVFGEQTTPL
jgi:hypothetical protein